MPEKWNHFIALNKELAPDWPVINETRAALPAADEFKDVEAKLELLDRSPGGNR